MPSTAKTIGKKSETDFYFCEEKLEKMRMREERLRGSRKQLNIRLSKKYSGGKKHGEKEKTRRDNQCFGRSIRIFGKGVIACDKILFVI